MTGITVTISPEQVERIVAEVVDRLGDRQPTTANGGDWLRGANAAAAYLGWPRSRIYDLTSRRAIPHHRDGSRLLFRRSELDRWLSAEAAA